MHLASNIRFLRTRRGLTQTDLAGELEKTSAAISDYEKGKSVPPLEVALRISQFFQVSIDDLVKKDLRREDILSTSGIAFEPASDYQSQYEQVRKQLQTQERMTQLLEQRLTELEREIREQAPALARRLGLEP